MNNLLVKLVINVAIMLLGSLKPEDIMKYVQLFLNGLKSKLEQQLDKDHPVIVGLDKIAAQ